MENEIKGKTEEFVHLDSKSKWKDELNIVPVVKYVGGGKQVLSQKSELVTDFGEDLQQLIHRLANTMYFYNAVGISAIQIGIPLSVCLVGVSKQNSAVLVNPEIISTSDEQVVENEGCLSFPEIFAAISRPKEIRVKFQEQDGTEKELDLQGIFARIVCHEANHICGKTMLDNVSQLKKNVILDKMKRITKNGKIKHDERVLTAISQMAEKEDEQNTN